MRNDSATSGEERLYVDRVNRAINYILSNLDQSLKLDVVAVVAGFSPFHFHRIFKMMIGESLAEFVKRVRLERAVALLSRQDWATRRKPSLTDIAFECGFTSSSDFSRSFKHSYGVPPSRFDVKEFRSARRQEWEAAIADPERRHLLKRLEPGANPDNFEVCIRSLRRRTVAYIRVADSYRPNAVPEAASRLVDWAQKKGLADGQWLGYMWDDPEIVPHDKCRYDVGLEVPPGETAHGEVCLIEFPEMQVAELEIYGSIDLEIRALDWMFKTWLPFSGYVPGAHPCFEAWIGRPFAHGFEKFELTVQVPIETG